MTESIFIVNSERYAKLGIAGVVFNDHCNQEDESHEDAKSIDIRQKNAFNKDFGNLDPYFF